MAAAASVEMKSRRLIPTLPNTAILPCVPLVARESDAFSLSCAFDHVPAAFTSLTLTTPTPTTVPAAP